MASAHSLVPKAGAGAEGTQSALLMHAFFS